MKKEPEDFVLVKNMNDYEVKTKLICIVWSMMTSS